MAMREEYENGQTIVKNTDNLLQENELLDYIVKVEDENFRCHRVILAASSHFFRALFRSNMKEEKDGCVTLNGVRASAFQIILNCLYSGKVVLTLDNFVDIWQAADELQIDFIVQNCEDFAKKATSLENWEHIFETALRFSSKNAFSICKTFLLKNFDAVSGSKTLMELDFNKFYELIDSDYLEVSSEDKVLDTVMKWVEYVPEETFNGEENERENERKRPQVLTTLLKSVRTCLVSTPLLKHLLKHRLILSVTETRDILIDAVLYKTTHYNNGQWPTAATHRTCSEFEHCGVTFCNAQFIIITAIHKKILKCAENNIVTLDIACVVYDSDLYATGVKHQSNSTSTLCVLSNKSWNKIAEVKGRQLILVSCNDAIFVLSKIKSTIYSITKKNSIIKVEKFAKLPNTLSVKHATHYQKMILIFCSNKINQEEKTIVYQLDILTKKLTELEQLNGPAEQMISFSDDSNTYILQTNGEMWKILCSSKTMYFENVGFLWSGEKELCGALVYKQTLIICYQSSTIDTRNKKFSIDYFTKIVYWEMNGNCSNMVPAILRKSELRPARRRMTKSYIQN
ncbi:kelch-like protein 28 [Physella acuta]|uniref:kelch-like protein 28 n=1 Tax=Physella acuta TaxID=109671 RepID=UPI0027DE9DB9|nr:kelch-like protein 28 [Physella acuta]